MLREYETTFILQPEITDEGAKAIHDRLDGILERNGAIRLLYDDDGKRRLAYDIQHFQKGHYVTLHYFDGGKAVPEVERPLRLDESVLRFLTVRVADEVGDIEERKRRRPRRSSSAPSAPPSARRSRPRKLATARPEARLGRESTTTRDEETTDEATARSGPRLGTATDRRPRPGARLTASRAFGGDERG